MINFSASADYGHTGQYVARIIGRNSKFTFEREFLGRKSGKRNEYTSADVDTPGIYEECAVDRKRGKQSTYYVLLEGRAGQCAHPIAKDAAMQIAKLLDAGHALGELAQLTEDESGLVLSLTPAAAKRAAAAQTLDTATEACWAVLQALPEKDAKKVLSALRARVSPPAPTAAPEAAEMPGVAP